jgi:hypothetical protein
MRRMLVFLVALVAVLVGTVVGVAPAVSAHRAQDPYCGIRWGSHARQADVVTYTSSRITDLRAGRHSCFDRLVIDLGASATGSPEVGYGYQVSYGPGPLDEETGQPVPMAGGAFLGVTVNAAAHDDNYNPTYAPADRLHAVNVSGFQTLRQVAFFGTFESQTGIVLGVRARLPFRVFILAGPGTGSRVVIDVAHRW